MLATLILGSMNYFFSRDLPLHLPEVRQAWAERNTGLDARTRHNDKGYLKLSGSLRIFGV